MDRQLGNNSHHNGHGTGDLTSVARNVAFLVGIYLYFAGWFYLYLYFRHFGVSLLGFDIPLTFFFVYAYPIVTSEFTSTKLLVLTIVALMFFITPMDSKSLGRRWLMAVLTVTLFPVLFVAAKESAEANAISFRLGHGAKVVTLTLDPDAAKNYPQGLIDANNRRELFLLLETKDRLYVVHQPTGTDDELPIASTYSVDRANILLADVDITNVSVKGQTK
jgi:hypothetical protein